MKTPKWWTHFITNIVTPSNLRTYAGRVKETPLLVAKKGIVVITPNGLGTIRNVNMNTSISSKKVTVDLYRGYPKDIPLIDIKQYVVLHTPTNQIFPIASTEYRYIYTVDQPIEYRLSNRNLALLTDSCKKSLSNVYAWNKLKHGYIIINELKKKHIKLI